MNDARVERMLAELHAGPPLRFLEDIFSLGEIAAGLLARGAEGRATRPALAAAAFAASTAR